MIPPDANPFQMISMIWLEGLQIIIYEQKFANDNVMNT